MVVHAYRQQYFRGRRSHYGGAPERTVRARMGGTGTVWTGVCAREGYTRHQHTCVLRRHRMAGDRKAGGLHRSGTCRGRGIVSCVSRRRGVDGRGRHVASESLGDGRDRWNACSCDGAHGGRRVWTAEASLQSRPMAACCRDIRSRAAALAEIRPDPHTGPGSGGDNGSDLVRMNCVVLYFYLVKATLTSFSGLTSLPVVRQDLVETRHVLTDW